MYRKSFFSVHFCTLRMNTYFVVSDGQNVRLRLTFNFLTYVLSCLQSIRVRAANFPLLKTHISRRKRMVYKREQVVKMSLVYVQMLMSSE